MKILGDSKTTEFVHFVKEPGILFGTNDVLKGKTITTNTLHVSMFVNGWFNRVTERKLYLHIPTTLWSSFTAKIREYCLPWKWKVAYLDKEDGSQNTRILVCPSLGNDSLPDALQNALDAGNGRYCEEILGHEYIRDIRVNTSLSVKTFTAIGQEYIDFGKPLYHIFRKRSVFSMIKYSFLKHFSKSWKEVMFQTAFISEKILIQKKDEETFNRQGLIRNA